MLCLPPQYKQTIHQLYKIFSAHGLPEQLITDNDPQFVTVAFCELVNGINGLRTSYGVEDQPSTE